MNIVAIGGGDRTPAVKKALELSGEPARVLIIPTAASTEAAYGRKATALTDYFKELGVQSNLLHEFGETPSLTKVQEELAKASLIYTFGGNTPYMIKTMHEHGTDVAIRDAILKGKVHAGLSAGALLPFRLAHSNVAAKPAEVDWDFSYLSPGVNLIDAVATAHADQHDPTPHGPRTDSRLEAMTHNFPTEVDRGFALDNGASAIFGDNPEIIRTTPDADVHFISRTDSGAIETRRARVDDLKK